MTAQPTAAGSRYEVKFKTAFDGLLAATETVTFARERDGQWRSIGYLIRPAEYPSVYESVGGKTHARWWMWTSFSSPQVREIGAHLTDAEKKETLRLGGLFGVWNAATFFVPFFFVLFAPKPFGWFLASGALVVGLAFYPTWSRMQMKFLCSTAWARKHGYTVENLRRFSFTTDNIWRAAIVIAGAILVAIATQKAFFHFAGMNSVPPPVQIAPGQEPAVNLHPPAGPEASFVLAAKAYQGNIDVALILIGKVGPPEDGRPPAAAGQQDKLVTLLFAIPENVTQTVVPKLQTGQPLVVETHDNEGKLQATGSLVAVANQIDPTTGTLACQATVRPMANVLLYPNQSVYVRLVLDTKSGVTLVPHDAVQMTGQGAFVYVIDADSRVSARPVVPGVDDRGRWEITSGLAPGEIVIAAPKERPPEGTKIRYKFDEELASPAADSPPAQPKTKGASTHFVTGVGHLQQAADDPSKWQITALVAEGDIAPVQNGQSVTFAVDAFPHRTFHGKVTQVANTPTTRDNVVSYETLIDVDDPEPKFRPGMTANVQYLIAETDAEKPTER
jgi:multidrug efflux pump subunit AcrA (membrane-fusion protein)